MFPALKDIAFKHLAIPATSGPSEWRFSAAGDIISSKRASLVAELARELIFLNGNLNKKFTFSAFVKKKKKLINNFASFRNCGVHISCVKICFYVCHDCS
jgi:hypothetical protein